MTLQQILYIVELSKHNSISAAAQALFIAQPSLSTAVRELEKELNITILERTRHGISFTPEGLEFLNYANHISEELTNLQEHFSQSSPEESKLHLSISSQHYMFAVDALIDYLQEIQAEPSYTVTLCEERTTEVIHDVITQRSQIGIIFLSKMTQKFMNRLLKKNGLEFTELIQFAPSVFINSHHPLASQDTISIEELSPYPYLQYTQGEDSYQFAEEVIIPDIKPARKIYITDRSALFNILSATEAYTIGTGILFRSLQNSDIRAIPLKNPLDVMRIGWIKLKSTTLPPEAGQYIRQLQHVLAASKVSPQ